MRVLGIVGLVGTIGLAPRIAAARPHHGASEVRDHRSHDAPVVRDHRSEPSAPVVRDHRSDDDTPAVRDHRDDDGGVIYEPTTVDDVTVVTDGGSSGGAFANVQGPTWTFEVGGLAHRFRGPSLSHSGSVEAIDGSMASYALESGTPADGDTAGGAFQMRFTLPATDHVYAGAEAGIGGLSRSPVRLMTDADLAISSRLLVDTVAVLGVRARRGIAELGGELAAGARFVSVQVAAPGATEDDPSSTVTAAAGLVEARLRGALWVSPHVFIAVQAGVGVFDRSDRNLGLSIGLSSRPFARPR